MSTYPAILETLQNIVDGTDSHRAIEASGILAGIRCFRFVICLVVYKKLFGVTANLSEIFHAESLDYSSAASIIQATIDTFSTMRSDDRWELLWQESMARNNPNKDSTCLRLQDLLLVHCNSSD